MQGGTDHGEDPRERSRLGLLVRAGCQVCIMARGGWQVRPMRKERPRKERLRRCAELAKLLSLVLHNSDVVRGEHAHK